MRSGPNSSVSHSAERDWRDDCEPDRDRAIPREASQEFTSGVESFEFICQDGNQAYELMVGSMGKVDRSSPLVP
jgi:hypothetical protein